jgi:hypothetical protein
MEYDEGEVLTDYIWAHYYSLITPAERHVGFPKPTSGMLPSLEARSIEQFGEETWADMKRWDSEGLPAFRKRVRDRLLREHARSIQITRCPKCNRIVRTPSAQQCLWCGFDWHVKGAQPPPPPERPKRPSYDRFERLLDALQSKTVNVEEFCYNATLHLVKEADDQRMQKCIDRMSPDLLTSYVGFLKFELEPVDFMPSAAPFLVDARDEQASLKVKQMLRPRYMRLYEISRMKLAETE